MKHVVVTKVLDVRVSGFVITCLDKRMPDW